MKKTPEEIMGEWREAFRKANYKEPYVMEYANGWYIVNGSKLRGKQVMFFTEELRRRITGGETE